MIGLSCYILADTYFVSKALGTSGLAALNLAISVYSVINATGLMMGAGGGTRFSIFMFQGHENEARRVYTRTVGLALAAGGVFLLAGLFARLPLQPFGGGCGYHGQNNGISARHPLFCAVFHHEQYPAGLCPQ